MDAALDELLSRTHLRHSKTGKSPAENPRRSEDFTVTGDSQFTGNGEFPLTVNRENPPPLYRDYNTETTTTTENSNASDSGGCGEGLIFPKCTENECIAIRQLLVSCPAEIRQAALDEIEGARQTGVIKTNLVPFARGIIMAIGRGTFTVGHGPKVAAQRVRQASRSKRQHTNDIAMDPETLRKGKALLGNLGL